MRIAYVVLAHKLPDQLVRLVERLSSPTSVFVIHVDSKAPEQVLRRVSSTLEPRGNIHFVEGRPIAWSGFSQVAATLAGLELLSRLETKFDYAFLLTGQHYPIKPVAEIEALLKGAQGRSLIEHFALPWRHWRAEGGGYNRLQYPYLEVKGRVIRLPIRRRIPTWLAPHGGSASGACHARAWTTSCTPSHDSLNSCVSSRPCAAQTSCSSRRCSATRRFATRSWTRP